MKRPLKGRFFRHRLHLFRFNVYLYKLDSMLLSINLQPLMKDLTPQTADFIYKAPKTMNKLNPIKKDVIAIKEALSNLTLLNEIDSF